MLEIHNTQSQASSQSGSSSSASVTDAHIADEVLDTRRRFRRGIKRKLSKSASSTRSAPPDFPPSVLEDVQRYIHESQQYMTMATRGGHSEDDHSTTAINRGLGGVDSAYVEDFVIANTKCQHVYLCSYPSRVHFDIVYHDAPASTTTISFRPSSPDSSRR
ncbi:LOW QUALITY PROTEIN: hypothetical protein TorRG33x02_236840 [Trema orientale]|uniref:Uncharacterized protein n=1 Tax=Trema orientale TaxID=63057 RepID=A0A2P5E082_TREOI|nr:LOW QUALITY PROTEIN: hypothetical protein TorRG33x02_236840 [Trema orientale]